MNELEFSEALENPEVEYQYSCVVQLSQDDSCFAPHKPLGNADVKIVYSADYDNNLHLKGYVKIPFQFVCDRCVSIFEKNLFLELNEVVAPKMSEDSELTYDMPRIDLDAIIKSFIITSFPSKVLCKEDCKGLCPKCGSNLNDGDCGCKA